MKRITNQHFIWKSIPVMLIFLIFITACRQTSSIPGLKKKHPRLILTDDLLKDLRQEYRKDTLFISYVSSILVQADSCLKKPLLVYKKGKMKSESQELVKRAYLLGFAWRWTHEKQYKETAVHNVVQVCRFQNWGADFLNKSEMAHGVAIIYDWFYPVINDTLKKFIENSLIEKTISPAIAVYEDALAIEKEENFTLQGEDSLGIWKERILPLSQVILRDHNKDWWPGCNHNWNVVCNSGNIIAALAIGEKFPELSQKVLDYGIRSIRRGLKSYASDGVWGEGPFLWKYTTDYTVYLLSSLKTALNNDFNLSSLQGISNTADFICSITSPAGKLFSFADNPHDLSLRPNPALFWFAHNFNRPYLANIEHHNIASSFVDVRDVMWYHKPVNDKLSENYFCFKGPVGLCVSCNDYSDKNSLFLACKAGFNQFNHSHLDLGTFVFDLNGERWAEDITTKDLGKDNFNLPNYWDGSQKGQRWDFISANSFGHNICVLNKQQQDAYARAEIIRSHSVPSGSEAVLDLSEAYPDAKSVYRRIRLTDNREKVEIVDSFDLKYKSEIRWQMITKSNPVVCGENEIELKKNGKTVRLKVLSPSNFRFNIQSVNRENNIDINEDYTKIEIVSDNCINNFVFVVTLSAYK